MTSSKEIDQKPIRWRSPDSNTYPNSWGTRTKGTPKFVLIFVKGWLGLRRITCALLGSEGGTWNKSGSKCSKQSNNVTQLVYIIMTTAVCQTERTPSEIRALGLTFQGGGVSCALWNHQSECHQSFSMASAGKETKQPLCWPGYDLPLKIRFVIEFSHALGHPRP